MLSDLRYAFRQLAKAPGFTAVAVLTLALGIGSTTAMFSAIYGVLLRPLPFPEADRLVTVRSMNEARGAQTFSNAFGASGPDYLDWAAQSRSFDGLAAAAWQQASLLGNDAPRQITVLAVSANYFDVFRTPPLPGRTFTASEASAGGRSCAVLSHAFWTEAFRADPGIVGQTLKLDSGPCTIIGIAAPELDYRQDVRPQLYVPLDFARDASRRSMRFLWVIGRLKPGVTLAQAQSELSALAGQLKIANPNTNRNWITRIWVLQEILTQGVRRPLVLLYAAAAAILLLACVNLAALLLVRAASRQQEVAIRSALGATRLQLIRQLFTESLLLALAGGILGTLVAWWGIDLTTGLARQLGSGGIEGAAQIAMSGPVLGLALLGTCGASLLFGIYPALYFSRVPLETVLRAAGRGLTARFSRQRALPALVVTQIALAFVLLVSAGLLTRSLLRLRQTNPGFNPTRLLVAELSRPASTRRQPIATRAAFATAVVERLNALPGVAGAAAVSSHPFSGNNLLQGFEIENRPAPAGVLMSAEKRMITPAYLRVLGIPILRGRGFENTDDGNHPIVLVDETFIRRFFGSDDPLGHTLMIGGSANEIVGIVGKVKDRSLGETELLPHVYVPLAQDCPSDLSFIVRTTQDSSTIAGSIQRAIAEVDPQQAVRRITLLTELVNRTIAPQRLSAALISALAGFALLLSTLGVYGVMAFSVAQRTRELAIRMAFGARTTDVFKAVLLRGAALAGIGVGLGAVGAFAIHRLLASFLFEVSAFDPASIAGALALLIGVALLAAWLPARRATKVNPIEALRAE